MDKDRKQEFLDAIEIINNFNSTIKTKNGHSREFSVMLKDEKSHVCLHLNMSTDIVKSRIKYFFSMQRYDLKTDRTAYLCCIFLTDKEVEKYLKEVIEKILS